MTGERAARERASVHAFTRRPGKDEFNCAGVDAHGWHAEGVLVVHAKCRVVRSISYVIEDCNAVIGTSHVSTHCICTHLIMSQMQTPAISSSATGTPRKVISKYIRRVVVVGRAETQGGKTWNLFYADNVDFAFAFGHLASYYACQFLFVPSAVRPSMAINIICASKFSAGQVQEAQRSAAFFALSMNALEPGFQPSWA